ncbi:MAG: hypothetical protein KH031_24075 [Clostridiales bacterium]|nr:hypothetical protein [Clostridiales bacterium]
MGINEFVSNLKSMGMKEVMIVLNNENINIKLMGCYIMGNNLYIEGIDDDDFIEIEEINQLQIEKKGHIYRLYNEKRICEIIIF